MGGALANTMFDIDARMTQIVGKPPRIEPTDQEDMTAEGMDRVIKLNASLGLTPNAIVPEYFRTMIKHPELFRCQLETGTALFEGMLSGRERELAVLRVAWLCRAPYQWGKHASLSRDYGVTTEEIERVILGSSAPGWDEHDAAILRGVEELLDDKMICDDTWAILAQVWSEPQLVEFTTLVGAYVTTALGSLEYRVEV